MRIKKYKDVVVAENEPVSVNMRVGGRLKYILRDINLNKLYESEWKDNLILDTGLPTLIGPNAFLYFFLGDDSTPPATNQTALLGHLGNTQTSVGTEINSDPTGPLYEFSTIRGRRFNAGVATGTIREFGVGDSAAQSNNDMLVRTLVEPEITKAADQVLDVYYEFICYPDLTDTVGQTTINGELYDYTLRVGNCIDFKYAMTNYIWSTGNTMLAYPDPSVLGAITGFPTEASVNCQANGSNAYDAPNGVMGTWLIGLDNGNIAGGIRCTAHAMNFGSLFDRPWVQIRWSRNSDNATISKDNTQTLQFKLRMAWDRYTP